MKIHVASKNPVKVKAVEETLVDYPLFRDAKVIGVESSSGVSEQPKSLEETVQGAVNRAIECLKGSSYGFGIESGLMEVPHTKTGKMDFCACAIYDGAQIHLGLSNAFEFPPAVTKMIHEQGIDANEALYRCGITTDRKVGSSEGAISILTKGRLTRKEYTKQAIQMALIHLENKGLY